MAQMHLDGLIRHGENERIEFKLTIAERASAAQTICAMLNSESGGTVLLGVRDNGTVTGIDIGAETYDRLRNEFRKIDPPIALDLETHPLPNGRSVIIVRVPGNTGLYRFEGRPYVRFGASTSVMPETTYQSMLLDRLHSITRWENRIAVDLTVENLDKDTIRGTIDEAVRSGRMSDPGTRDIWRLLLGLHLVSGDRLLNAAGILFGDEDWLAIHFPQCRLRLARFRGDKMDEFIDNRQYIGNAFSLLHRAQNFVNDHMPIAGRFIPSRFERVDTPLYPVDALREALANALCHRDYSELSGGVDVAIFSDRLEVTNTGGLRFGLTVDDLVREHQSRPWNPLIAQVFYLRGLIETWGRGTLKIVEATELAHLEPPEFESSQLSFKVRFRSGIEGGPDRFQDALTDLQKAIVDFLRGHGPAQVSAIESGLTGRYPRRSIRSQLQVLRETGLVELHGERRGARWSLKID